MYISSLLTLTLTTTTLITLAAALPTTSPSLSPRANEACGLHWQIKSVNSGPYSIDVTWKNPSTTPGAQVVQSQSGDLNNGLSLCNDKFSLCLTVNQNDPGTNGPFVRYGFGADIWLSTDTPRCSVGKFDEFSTGFLFSGDAVLTQDGDCSFSCREAMV